MVFNRLSIIGVGLLGGSIGLAVKARSKSCQIVGYGHRPQSLETAKELGAVDLIAGSIAQSASGSDLIVICTPVSAFAPILSELSKHLKPGTVVTDVASTKRSVVRLAEEILPSSARFVGSHPMAGSEKKGIEAARSDLFEGAACVTTPVAQTDPQALQAVDEFWTDLGMKITRCSPEGHDQRMASISHLPHAVAAALMQIQDSNSSKLAGKGFLDATRIAAGDPILWKDILLDNADNLRTAIDTLQAELAKLKELIDPNSAQKLQAWLDSAARKRSEL